MPRRVYTAILIAFVFHGLFILTARYRLSYDAYTHMLFADHYAESWFSLWEPRWYTGFTVVSYPPLAHQLIALFTPLLGFDKAFALLLWIIATCYPLGIYAFARIFTGRSAASYAALVSAILVPIYVTAYVFGQLPFLASTLIALFAAASLDRYLRQGDLHSLLLSVMLIATCMATHHATLIVQPFFVLAVAINNLGLLRNQDQRRALLLIVKRLSLFGLLAIAMTLLVIWPFWQWGSDQTIQTPIDHLSRHNFFQDPRGFLVFFFPLYGPLVFIIPFLIRKWSPRFMGLLFSFAILFLLGLGGTTPLPSLIFGPAWEWLTFDRFAFWASLTLTPFFGILFIRLRYGWKNRLVTKPVPVLLQRNLLFASAFSVFALTTLLVWFWPIVFPTQPEPIDMGPIVNFLDQDNNSQWRYLTFGFGNQYTYLNLLTEATTIDGSYHTARALPELRESGIAEVDTAYWANDGIPAIAPILQKSGDHGVRWGFVNPKILQTIPLRWGVIHRSEFAALLEQLGWIRRDALENGILVYENPNVLLPAPSTAPKTTPFASFSWGVFPLLALVTSLSLGALKVYPAEAKRVIERVYAVVILLIPISICFWYFRTVFEFPHPRVYFLYTDAVFFLTDALVLLAVILWVSTKLSQSADLLYRVNFRRSLVSSFLTALVLFASLSVIWSYDWRISVFVSLHSWLALLLIFSLREWQSAWKMAMLGLCLALSIEAAAGFVGFGSQSTAFLQPLHVEWPGALESSTRGASVVQIANGLRILRAYGTLPHPNTLGGFTLLTLLGPVSLFFLYKKTHYALPILFSLGIVLIVLTFSRSAWLGLLAFLGVLILKAAHLDYRRLYLVIAVSVLTIALTVYPLRELIFTRMSNAPVPTEQMSKFGRQWLNEQALKIFQESPLGGVGIGSFILKLSSDAVDGAMIEPVHGLPFLVGTELGILGLLLLVGLAAAVALSVLRADTPRSILASAMLIGLGVTGLFDHYLWTLAPGRIMLSLALGLWLGKIHHDA